MKFLFVLTCVAGVLSMPAQDIFDPVSVFTSGSGLSEADYDRLDIMMSTSRVGQYLPGFKYIFVTPDGQIFNDSTAINGSKLEIAGSPRTTYNAMLAAADVAIKMTRNTPSEIFDRLTKVSSVGVFSRTEKLVVFPVYARYANGNCGHSCSGACHVTCSADGRKIQNVAGLGGVRAVVLDDNVLCTSHDPYYHKQNILAHEFTHTIHLHALTGWMKNKIKATYQAAKRNKTWGLTSYAMSNAREYLAEAATVYLGVNKNNRWQAGGMNWCNGAFCKTEMDGRERLNATDPELFKILTHIFMHDDPTIPSNLTVCPDRAIFNH